jgi:hypothetical protein
MPYVPTFVEQSDYVGTDVQRRCQDTEELA